MNVQLNIASMPPRSGLSPRAGHCLIKRVVGDKPAKTESQLLYWIKKELIKQGWDVIKQRCERDGHMISNEHYIRSRKWKGLDALLIYDENYALKCSHQTYNKFNEVIFKVEAYGNIQNLRT